MGYRRFWLTNIPVLGELKELEEKFRKKHIGSGTEDMTEGGLGAGSMGIMQREDISVKPQDPAPSDFGKPGKVCQSENCGHVHEKRTLQAQLEKETIPKKRAEIENRAFVRKLTIILIL